MDVFGVRLVGINAETGVKALLTVALVLGLVLARALLSRAARGVGGGHVGLGAGRAHFWIRQVGSLVALAFVVVGVAAIWFDDPGRLATVVGLISAGVAVALQRVITSFAAYLIILRGRVFTVGDRITMAEVRGDVVELGFTQTTVMEMGEPPAVQSADPAVWVRARQYTGRLVRITNDRIFDSPVYNYTREFPYLWEEIQLPIKYGADRERAEAILLDAARRHTSDLIEHAGRGLDVLRQRYFLPADASPEPAVYFRLTDNWLELTVRFIASEHGVRPLKDAISRDVLAALDAAGIEVASATYEIVGVPPLRLERVPAQARAGSPPGGGAAT